MSRFFALILWIVLPMNAAHAAQVGASQDVRNTENANTENANTESNNVVKRKISSVKKLEYNALIAPDKIFETPLDIAQYYVGAYPMLVVGRPLVDVKIGRESETAPHLTMLITASGFEADTVYGEQWRIRIASIAQDKDWRIASAEHRYQCLRSNGIPDWSLKPCS